MQVYTAKNLLEANERTELKLLMEKEIEEALDTQASKYQSESPQHLKHQDCVPLQTLCKKLEEVGAQLTQAKVTVKNCWFIICREDSNFDFHNHSAEKLSAVYYLENCNNNGTIFESFYTKLQVLSEDDTVIFFDPNQMHSTPKWNGSDRYSIAFDLDIQS